MLLSCLLLCLAAAPNDNAEIELASALARRGWIDLADELCVRIEKMPGASIVLAEVASARARQMPEPAASAKELDAAVLRMGTTLTPDERGMAGVLRVQKARVLGETPEAAKAWQDAETFYGTSIAALKALPDNQSVEEALLDARLELPKTIAARARLVAGDEVLKKKLLQQAVVLFVDFQFDTGTRPIAYEALLEEGKARIDLKDYARAERCFQGVLALNLKGPLQGNYLKSLKDSAFLNLLRVKTAAGRCADAIQTADVYLKEPVQAKSVMGLAVQMAKAEALAAGGNRAGAILLAQAIAAADPYGSTGIDARNRIREWTKDGNGGATASLMLLIADGLMDRGLYKEALVDLRRCVELCKDAADLAVHEPVAAFKRGECFRALKREAEASLAYQDVFRKYPKHDLAQRAAFEAVRALIRSAASTRDRRDEEQQEALLKEIEERGLQGAFADFFTFLRAEILERKGQWKGAAELYQKVGEGCEVYDDALVSAGHCLRRDVDAKGDPKQLQVAETLLRKAASRLEKAPQPRLMVLAQFELSTILLQSRPREALEFIVRCAAQLPADSEMLPRLGEMEIRARLATGDLAGASARLEKLLAGNTGGAAAVRSLRRVAAGLEATDPAKAARYYRVWLDRAETEDTSLGDARAVADGLYRMARELNKVDKKVVSVLDLRGKPVLQRSIWSDAAQAQQRLLALKGLSASERSSAQFLLICCESLMADSAADWGRVKTHCDDLFKEYKLIQATGLNGAVLQQEHWLAGVYLDYAHALYQLGKAGQKFQYANAYAAFRDFGELAQKRSEPWWLCKLLQTRVLFERGEGSDVTVADVILTNLERSYPDFDEGKFGLKPLLIELRDQVKASVGLRK